MPPIDRARNVALFAPRVKQTPFRCIPTNGTKESADDPEALCPSIFVLLSESANRIYENEIPFELRMLETGSDASAQLFRLWSLQRFPVLDDRGRIIPEATIIIEYLAVHYRGPVQLAPSDPVAAIDVRLMDRFFDNYVMTPQQGIVFDFVRPQGKQDAYGVEQSRALLDKAYRWLDERMADRTWAAGEAFSLADFSMIHGTSLTSAFEWPSGTLATIGCTPRESRCGVVIIARSALSIGRFGSDRKFATPASVLSASA